MSRRPEFDRLAVALLTGVALGALSGCEGTPEHEAGPVAMAEPFCREVLPRVDSFMAAVAPEPDALAERYGGTAVVAGAAELAGGMNVLVTQDLESNEHQVFLNLMTLLRYDDDLDPAPYLAESWELDPEAGTVTFHLRDDVFWHDGTRTTASDVAFTYERVTAPGAGFPNAAAFALYEPGAQGVEVVDSFTVRVRLRPQAEPLDPWTWLGILPRHLLGEVPPAALPGHPYGRLCPVGNGPFRFVSHREGASWTFASNPAFPEDLGGRPFLDRYIYRVVPEAATRTTELLTGALDVDLAPSLDQLSRIEGSERVEVLSFYGRAFEFVAWNTRRPHLADARVRRALTLATDRQGMVDQLMRGRGTVVNALVPLSHWTFQPDLADSLSYDEERARALLDDAGWLDRDGDGVRENAAGEPLEISLLFPATSGRLRNVAEVMQITLGRIGVEVALEPAEFQVLLERIGSTREFDGVILRMATLLKLDDSPSFHSTRVEEPFAWAGVQDAELDRYLDTLVILSDRDEARRLSREYQLRLLELQPFTLLWSPEEVFGVASRLEGVEMDVRGRLQTAARWWIPAGERR